MEKELPSPSRRAELELGSLSSGSYFLRIDRMDGNRPVVKKVLLQGE